MPKMRYTIVTETVDNLSRYISRIVDSWSGRNMCVRAHNWATPPSELREVLRKLNNLEE